MDELDLKEIRAARPTNLARIACAVIFLIIYFTHNFSILLYSALLQLVLSSLWFWFIESKFKVYKTKPNLWYIPASIDVYFLTLCVYITGVSYSPVTLGYILLACMSSVDLIRNRGLFTTIFSCVSYLGIVIAVKFNFLPFINIVNETHSEITLFSAILSLLLLIIACFTANSVIYQIYFQLNEKNVDLSNSLDETKRLKLQQDADYALTARLMEPFTGNLVKSNRFKIEFYMKQKKSFTFKGHSMEIGGDILIADEIYLNDNKFILFINGDAMGKSMQGACGALVLGAICKSIITNIQVNGKDNKLNPQDWLLNFLTEIHRIFESFDGSMLASAFIGLIEEKTGGLYYVNTEHPQAILYRDENASFITDIHLYRKIGTLEIQKNFDSVDYFSLVEGDMLFIGSDGKDDIQLNSSTDQTREINQDEKLFPRIVKKTQGNLDNIVKEIKANGKLTDDLSILKISFL